VITFDGVSIRYGAGQPLVLSQVDLNVDEGELCLVVGSTGSGKSTLLGAINGLVPHFTGGILSGRVSVDGRDTRTHPPRELADLVGVVGQDPRASFVADIVEDELAYTMESLSLPPDVMRRRIEDVLDVLSLADLRDRPVSTLSAGQAQRVAIGAVLTAHPKVLVLDEPTSALDPAAAEEVLAVLQRLVHDNGLTVVLAEHRLERVLHYADSVIWVPGAGAPLVHGDPAEVIAQAPVFPSVVGLGRVSGWHPLPLSVRDARRRSSALRASLPPTPTAAPEPDGDTADATTARSGSASGWRSGTRDTSVAGRTSRLTVRFGDVTALDGVDLQLRRGEVVALMGRNGAGKSSLLASLVGVVKPTRGQVRVGGEPGHDPRSLAPAALIAEVGLVPQQPADLLYAETVARECAGADRESRTCAGTCARYLAEIAGPVDPALHPRDLSEGQRLALALAVILTASPDLVLLDEPTRGLDYPAKARLVGALRRLARAGHAIVLATHDVELAAEVADRTVVLADGTVVADGPSREVVTHSPVFAPQVAKVLSPLPYLTVADVTRTLAALS
jgi:energy-coupling factor transporter ATP-binding protein EcfA2